MSNQQLTDYIKRSRQNGIGNDQIQKSLIESGWNISEVESALKFKDDDTTGELGRLVRKETVRGVHMLGTSTFYWGELHLYESGLVIYNFFLVKHEKYLSIPLNNIIEVGIMPLRKYLLYFWLAGGFAWLYIKYKDSKTNEEKMVFMWPRPRLYRPFKERKKWFDAFRSLNVRVR